MMRVHCPCRRRGRVAARGAPSKDCMIQLILKRASASRSSSELSDDDYDVLCEGAMVGRIMKATAPVGQPWLWTLAYGHHEDLARTHTAMSRRARPR